MARSLLSTIILVFWGHEKTYADAVFGFKHSGNSVFLCLAQGNTWAWFHSSGNREKCPVFESPRSAEDVSKTYTFMPNAVDAASEIRLYRTFSKDSFPASAGELKIDIPFNLLSASVTDVQALLDRRIAANLRLKNLLEQYLALQKKNAELLKALSIPYLEAKENRKKGRSASDAEELVPADGLKKNGRGDSFSGQRQRSAADSEQQRFSDGSGREKRQGQFSACA